MTRYRDILARRWLQVSPKLLPFADAASDAMPLSRLLRLSLFQVSVGMALVLLTGTLNRVMVVELAVPAWLVATMVALPLLLAPFRVLIGFRSDHHRSALGWRRVPYIWMGTLLQFGGLAIMPFALLILSGDTHGPLWVGHVSAALAFLLVGAGLHTVQTAGLALATDLAPESKKPQVVALLYVTLLIGMFFGALAFGRLLADFSQIRLIRVIQGAAVLTILLNVVALWKQELRQPSRTRGDGPRRGFREAWRQLSQTGRATRLLVAVALGTAAFTMQDVLLEPYGGQILGLGVSATTELTAVLVGGTLLALAFAARMLTRGGDPLRLSAIGALTGVAAFSAVIFAGPLASTALFRIGVALIGFGGGLFAVGMLIAAMNLARNGDSGMALGAWGAVQATTTGVAVVVGGAVRDAVSSLAESGALGVALQSPTTGYSVVYHLEIGLLFATLVALGPLVRRYPVSPTEATPNLGLAEYPG